MSNFFFALLGLIAVAFFLFCPVFLRLSFYYELESGKTGFCCDLYGIIKLFGGYITTCPGGLAIHLTKGKAYLLSYRQMDDDRKKYTKKNGIMIDKIEVFCESGYEYFLQLSLLENAIKTIFLFFLQKGVTLRSRTVAVAEDTLRFYAKIIVKIAVYAQVLSLIRYFIGRIKEWQMKAKN